MTSIIYYTQNLRDLLWVLPIYQESGGTFCSELETTCRQVREYDASLPMKHLPTKGKWTIGRDVGSRRLKLKRKPVRLTLEQVARQLKPDVIVTTSNHRHAISRERRAQLCKSDPYWSRVKQVQAFHGVSSKGVKFNAWMSDFDLLLLPGRRERDKFAALRVLDSTTYELIGHPKSDRVLRGEITRDIARQTLNLSDAPTVLYAPTYGALSSFFKWGEAICESVPPKCNLIVKPHPSLVTNSQSDNAGLEIIQRVRQLLENRGALWLPHEPDVVPLMAASDILITDYSSVAEEFLVFDRPLVFADHLANATDKASRNDRAHRDKGDWNGIFACGRVVTNIEAMPQAVIESLCESQRRESSTRNDGILDKHAPVRRQLRDYVFENLDGHCAQRAANAIKSLVA
ncbi:MAG TPA: CDP-glycerol glycerophosphotransferase family protein [Abditibacteriaceae bacterium]|nr:CDP-glycerol glycerophosphotransferase family protein [Abditibacteriaceae bacterium]